MKVLTTDAIQDPTRVEARVRREVAMRKHQHEKMNTERKLTDEQRREKVETKKVDEEKKGIIGAVFKYVFFFSANAHSPLIIPLFFIFAFRVKNLSDKSHQFKVRKNAEQLNLTGVCIFNPQFNVIYVEGAPKFIKNYKRLMLHRIAWTEPARPRGGEDVELENPESGAEGNGTAGADDGATGAGGTADPKGKGKAKADGEGAEEGSAGSLEDNKCWLIWEGMLRERTFTGFRARSCPTERDAKELLGDIKSYWDMAKNWKGEEEELF